jgi:hypothetical protein
MDTMCVITPTKQHYKKGKKIICTMNEYAR